MKRTVLFSAVMVAMMSMASVNAQAQRRGHNQYDAPRQEMRFGDRGMEMRGGHHEGMHQEYRHEGPSRRHQSHGYYEAPRHGHVVAHHAPHMHVDAYGYMPGWEGRVRYLDGRWGYYRDNCWMWYDTYYEPAYYYAHPVRHFHAHYLSPTGRRVAAGVAGAVALGTLVGALCR